ncbi:uncharacterized protein UTRI_10178 [Ustilago trichophora]|uniref:Uncharacterized protein n=1 Tax=Ustilago trichophora TaxID=86804 RepID=A0A5C3ECK4_9BASI|nr:uncharacterized protein UTRI_10178 [Ustilago trichophora]
MPLFVLSPPTSSSTDSTPTSISVPVTRTRFTVPVTKRSTAPPTLPSSSVPFVPTATLPESAPFAFFLIFLAELNGAPTSLVHAAYTTLFAARVAHANLGIQADNSAAPGRAIGTIVTLAVTIGAGLYNVCTSLSTTGTIFAGISCY